MEKSFEMDWQPVVPAEWADEMRVIVCRPGGEVLVPEGAPVLPDAPFFQGKISDSWSLLGIGRLEGRPVCLAAAPAMGKVPEGYEWRSPRTLFHGVNTLQAGMISRASMLASWDWNFRFCSRCGVKTERHKKELARVCPSCGFRSYPRISPAMIVLIEASEAAGFSEPRILLAHNRRFPQGVYSCLAGYVEAGETAENAVLREVREEVGLQAERPRFVGSQAWPMPHSLMLGFESRAAGTPVPDGVEIEDARWFSARDLPHVPRRGSIARFLIDRWLEGQR